MVDVALITGAAVRIGNAIAWTLANRGFAVAIHYNRSETEATDLVNKIRASGGKAEAFRASLSTPGAFLDLVQVVQDKMGPVTCLVNNASQFEDDRLQTFSLSEWDDHFTVNLQAPVVLAQQMAARLPVGAKGNIINIIDQRVLKPNPQFFTYTLSKAALWSATKTMAQALAPHIRVNAIAPGPVLRSRHQTEAEFDEENAATLLGSGTTPKQIADAIVFLLSSPSITGQMLALDGGQHLLWQTADLPSD